MSNQGKASFEFGPFVLDASQGTLSRGGELIPVSPKALDTLLALVESGGKLVEKDELLRKVWPDSFVEEGSLTQNISILRKLLGESDAQPYIQTIPKRGYRFLGKVTLRTESPSTSDTEDFTREVPRVAPPSPFNQGFLKGISIAALAAAVVFVWLRTRPAPLTDRDVVVLADFTNSTSDPVFDGTLREALAYQLEESPFLRVLDDAVMRQDLELMRRSPTDRITQDIAHDICVREADKAMLTASIASLGKEYLVSLKASNCETGATVARTQAQAEGKEEVLQAVASASRAMRAKLGESLASIQKLAPPPGIQRVTTPSIEAFQAFEQGRTLFNQGRIPEAIPFFRRATDLDPELAFAWSYLSSACQSSSCESVEYQNYSDKAWALRDRVSEYERLWLTSSRYANTGPLDKAVEAYGAWQHTYPRDPAPFILLGLVRARVGQFEEALKSDLAGYELSPRQPFYAGFVMSDYIRLDRFAEAKEIAERHFSQGWDNPEVHKNLLRIANIEGDQQARAKQMDWFHGKPEEYLWFDDEAAFARIKGQLAKSQELSATGAELARKNGRPNIAARLLAPDTENDALLEICNSTRASSVFAPATVAFCGDPSGLAAAEQKADQIVKSRPADTLWNEVRAPMIHASAQFRRGHFQNAIELLRSTAPYERAFPFAIFLRGSAYLRLHRGAEAAVEFHKIADHPGANWGPLYSLSQLGLARSAAAVQDEGNANKSYQAFLNLWRDADPGRPLLIQARKEFSALRQ